MAFKFIKLSLLLLLFGITTIRAQQTTIMIYEDVKVRYKLDDTPKTYKEITDTLQQQPALLSNLSIEIEDDEEESDEEREYYKCNSSKIKGFNKIFGFLTRNGIRINNLQQLSLKGVFDAHLVLNIGKLTALTSLRFQEGSVINCQDYTPWETLTNLTSLDLKGTYFSQSEEATEGKPLILKSFFIILENLKNLKTLDLSNSQIFPKRIEDNKNYMRWRKKEIKDCAKLLADKFHGSKLYMSEASLGGLFLEAFIIPSSSKIRELDLSKNYISIDAARDFIISLKGKLLDVTFDDNEWTLDELKEKLLNHYLEGTSLSG